MELDKLITYSSIIDITENPEAEPNPNLCSDLEKDIDYLQLLSDMLKELAEKASDGKIKDADLNKVKKRLKQLTLKISKIYLVIKILSLLL